MKVRDGNTTATKSKPRKLKYPFISTIPATPLPAHTKPRAAPHTPHPYVRVTSTILLCATFPVSFSTSTRNNACEPGTESAKSVSNTTGFAKSTPTSDTVCTVLAASPSHTVPGEYSNRAFFIFACTGIAADTTAFTFTPSHAPDTTAASGVVPFSGVNLGNESPIAVPGPKYVGNTSR